VPDGVEPAERERVAVADAASVYKVMRASGWTPRSTSVAVPRGL